MGHLLIIFGIRGIELQVLEHVKSFGFVNGRWGGGVEERGPIPPDNISITILIISPAGITSRQIIGIILVNMDWRYIQNVLTVLITEYLKLIKETD